MNSCLRPGWVVFFVCFVFCHSFFVEGVFALREVVLNSSQTQTQERTYTICQGIFVSVHSGVKYEVSGVENNKWTQKLD